MTSASVKFLNLRRVGQSDRVTTNLEDPARLPIPSGRPCLVNISHFYECNRKYIKLRRMIPTPTPLLEQITLHVLQGSTADTLSASRSGPPRGKIRHDSRPPGDTFVAQKFSRGPENSALTNLLTLQEPVVIPKSQSTSLIGHGLTTTSLQHFRNSWSRSSSPQSCTKIIYKLTARAGNSGSQSISSSSVFLTPPCCSFRLFASSDRKLSNEPSPLKIFAPGPCS